MPTLLELEDETTLTAFSVSVARQVEEGYQEEISLNDGISSSEDLTNVHAAGENVMFDINRLISDAESFE